MRLGLLVIPIMGLLAAQLTTQAAESTTSELALLEACAAGDIAAFPNPFSDLDPEHWAYAAVIKLHYCGAYRGAIAPEALLRDR